jgi:simple sugar transport system ATP-binding protein
MQPGSPILKVANLEVKDETGRMLIKDVSFQINSGEIVGIAGVAGNGQTELVEAIIGLSPLDGGHIYLNGEDISSQPLTERRKEISYIPEDRVSVGLAIDAQVAENLIMGFQDQPSIADHQFLRRSTVLNFAAGLINKFGIKVNQASEPVSNLSGGNLQKVVVARELTHGFPLLIADQPTRGVDIGSIEFIYQQLVNYRTEGKAILLVSADLNEIMTLSDRILVMYEGQIAGEVAGGNAQEETLGMMMTGAWKGPSLVAAHG